MKVKSFIKEGHSLTPIEIDLGLLPGLPNLHFLGKVDKQVKESGLRIKSAIKRQGFQWPQTQQVIVDMGSSSINKSGEGLELAVVCAYLWATGQMEKPESWGETPIVYGSINIEGKAFLPKDFHALADYQGKEPIVTGQGSKSFNFPMLSISELKDLVTPEWIEPNSSDHWRSEVQRPPLSKLKVNSEVAKLLTIVAAGEHNAMLAGPAGSGKSTFAEILPGLLKYPSKREHFQIQKMAKVMGYKENWRPVVAPHHSIPKISMLGGGTPIYPGEISRAHGGVLVLDEFLEFSQNVKEALREPIEKGEITICRRGERKFWPAKFLLIATSNLCPCGDLVPNKIKHCRFSLTRCRSYTERLSGPLMDRFQLLAFTQDWQQAGDVSIDKVFEDVQRAQEFAKEKRGQEKVNSHMDVEELECQIERDTFKCCMPQNIGSRRRYQSLIHVSRTLADLEGIEQINHRHIQEAMFFVHRPFEQMKSIFA